MKTTILGTTCLFIGLLALVMWAAIPQLDWLSMPISLLAPLGLIIVLAKEG